jgi:hypothetical protein
LITCCPNKLRKFTDCWNKRRWARTSTSTTSWRCPAYPGSPAASDPADLEHRLLLTFAGTFRGAAPGDAQSAWRTLGTG